jgi:plastocyanin
VKRTLICAAAMACAAAVPSVAAAKNVPLPATDFKFGAKKNNKITASVGDKLVFTWKSGVHNVISSKLPKGVKKVNSGNPTDEHAPFKITLSKKGVYSFYCAPHAPLGMTVTITVK